MPRQKLITQITKTCETPFLRLYETSYLDGTAPRKWFHTSRHKEPRREISGADSVAIIPVIKVRAGDEWIHKLVMVRQFRPPLQGNELAFPAGLCGADEEVLAAASRELHEETGLTIQRVLHTSPTVYNSAGMTDESVVLLFVEASGTPTTANQEKDEDIEVILLSESEAVQLVNGRSPNSGDKLSAKAYLALMLAVNPGLEKLLEMQ